ncbi:MAG TPA: STAS/SEC14 domain-containing protein [Candidatus Saccharimonadales bacterium]
MIHNPKFTAEVGDGFIHLKTRGKLNADDLDAPVDAALKLAAEKDIHNLLDDIREVDHTDFSMHVQSKSMGVMWKLRKFKKVAIIMDGGALKTLFMSTLSVLHLNHSQFKAFDNPNDAIRWLTDKA